MRTVLDIPPLTRVRDYSRDGVRRSLEESLGRLGLDRVDIVLIHDPDDFMGTRRTKRTPRDDGRRRGHPHAAGIAADVSYLPVQIPGELWAELNRVRQR